ncbi:MAG: tetratricopeptide repeat protein [Deltaproteobacteria bacterium]|nr:tetratricopeptide repeat protein [Deltaproteobacteria bacterium]
MSTSHLDRKELKAPDAFLAKTGALFKVVRQNARALFVAAAVALVGSAGYILYQNAKAEKEMKAENELYAAKKSFVETMSKLPKGDAKAAQDWKANSKADFERFEALARKLPNTAAAYDAWMTLGNINFELGSSDAAAAERAAQYFEKASTIAQGKSLQATALYAKAYALETLGKYDEAIGALSRLLDSDFKGLKADSLIALARNNELKGDKANAVKLYEQFMKDFPDSTMNKSVEAILARLKK